MEKVLGFGGFFFRAADPEALADWYATRFGVDRPPSDYETPPWRPAGGPCVFAPFDTGTAYIGDAARQFMLSFRVRDLDAMIAQLEEAGVAVEGDPKSYPDGRFARLTDSEGNPIELWEPY